MQAVSSALSSLRLQALAYLAVSVVALGCDTVVYLLAARLGVGAAAAGAGGYVLGLLVHYALSRSLVFEVSHTAKSEARLFLEFAASGVLGLGITVTVIGTSVEVLGLALLPAKIAATAVSFVSVFLIRRFMVFGG